MEIPWTSIVAALQDVAIEVFSSHPWLVLPLIWGSIAAYKSPQLAREILFYWTQRRRDKQEHARLRSQIKNQTSSETNGSSALQGHSNDATHLDSLGNRGRRSNLVPSSGD
ncbi:MAG: hypothetical protein IKE66_09855 [Hyphomicrobium sp.]|nr:hypothetical protein [Hyphomicrobium sp.]